ncbi:MAG: hypothetical protein R3C41_02630 [Calditrichia bacterium]|nr:hypothetical protein [Calditrichota bacterium]MCB0269891.1 hypothetical protein [Calditrichota bacterium]MCB0285975.1 hypothetical protein [Calditrichota bacterium]MCB9067495.1 hypothetical protein [Calditrichia bacterium]
MNEDILKGLLALTVESKDHAEIPLQKIIAMQDIYLKNNPTLYTQKQIKQLDYYLKAVAYKFQLTTISLEQLWSLSYMKRRELDYALKNSLDRLDVFDNELIMVSFVLEGFLFQSRSLIDFLMLYICFFLKTGHQGSITKSKFYKELDKTLGDPFSQKASLVNEYFRSKIFGTSDWEGLNPNNWGSLIESLRNKIAHRDIIRPSFNSDESIFDNILFNWPTIQGITYDRFCQYMQNGIFTSFVNLSPILYELEWKSGPYMPTLWD